MSTLLIFLITARSWTKAEAAEFLKVKPRTIDDWMSSGAHSYYKLPSGTVRFRRDQLIEFLGKFEVGGLSARKRQESFRYLSVISWRPHRRPARA